MSPIPECLIDQLEPVSGRSFSQAREVPHTHVVACDDSPPMTIEGDAAKLLEKAFRVVGAQEVVVEDGGVHRPGVHEQGSYSPGVPPNLNSPYDCGMDRHSATQ